MIELCARSGYHEASIERLSAHAGVSSATFYELFGDKETLLAAAMKASAQRIFGAESDAADNVHAALSGLFERLREDPNAGRLLFIEGLGAGELMRKQRGRVLSAFERHVQALLDSCAVEVLDIPVIAITGALRTVVSRQLRTQAEDELPSLLDDSLDWLYSYAVEDGSKRWSTGAGALQPAAPRAHAPPALTPELQRLPPGRHGLPAGVIARSQRTRIIFATAEVTMAKGYANTKVEDIVAAAQIARPVFYEHFQSKEDAFLEAQNFHTQFILDSCAKAYFSAKEWPERMWRCLGTLIRLIYENQAISHLRLVECYGAGRAAIRRAEEITRSFTIFLEEGYHYREQARELPALYTQAIAGAIFEVVQRPVARRESLALTAHLPQLTYIALAPFTGAQEAIALVEEIKGRQGPEGWS
jgi:AcrR family transcriptional regulator